jgi:hypothetical protein
MIRKWKVMREEYFPRNAGWRIEDLVLRGVCGGTEMMRMISMCIHWKMMTMVKVTGWSDNGEEHQTISGRRRFLEK